MLEVSNLSKHFGGLRAVDNVAFRIAEASIIALIGPNGAGKTTVFALLAGFLVPDTGSIRLAGREITGMAPERICRLGLARTFQLVQPFSALTVRENIAVGIHLHVRGRKAALAKAAAMGERLGLGDMLDRRADSLTIAGRKRLELARALATQPKLLLLDEVMAGLNPTEIDQIVPLIREIRASGTTILLTEHVMQAVAQLADSVYVLNDGALIAAGTPAEIAANPTVIEAYLGHGAAGMLGEAARA
jgi:branched-chain amino acid transport system ATP-binding protein